MPLEVDPDAPGFVCDVPEELPAEFVEPEFGKLEFVEPEFVVVGSDPEFAGGIRAWVRGRRIGRTRRSRHASGSVPHGDPLA